MKAILISIKPKWVAKILNGEKTIEVRKNKALANAIQKLIDEYGFAEIYVYCSKNENLFYVNYEPCGGKGYVATKLDGETNNLNGKVIFKFRCYKVDTFTLKMIRGGLYFSKSGLIDFPNEEAQLDNFELLDYAGEKLGTKLYAINISDLEIFDKPKELSEFKSYKKNIVNTKINGMVFETELDNSLIKAPQNMCYVEVKI